MNRIRHAHARRHVAFAMKLAAAIVVAALMLSFARAQGWIDGDALVRAFNVVMGLAFAAYGNAMPKFMHEVPPRSLHEATLQQAIARVASWTMTLAFLAWAALWAFAPRELAMPASLAAVAAGVLVTLAIVAWTAARSGGRDAGG